MEKLTRRNIGNILKMLAIIIVLLVLSAHIFQMVQRQFERGINKLYRVELGISQGDT